MSISLTTKQLTLILIGALSQTASGWTSIRNFTDIPITVTLTIDRESVVMGPSDYEQRITLVPFETIKLHPWDTSGNAVRRVKLSIESPNKKVKTRTFDELEPLAWHNRAFVVFEGFDGLAVRTAEKTVDFPQRIVLN